MIPKACQTGQAGVCEGIVHAGPTTSRAVGDQILLKNVESCEACGKVVALANLSEVSSSVCEYSILLVNWGGARILEELKILGD